MKIKMTVAALVLALTPGIASAMGCHGSAHSSQQAAMSCAEGTLLDVETNTCVPLTTG